MCAYQMLTNFGWAFVINSMSTYLRDVRHLSESMNGYISTLTLFIGLFGLLLGGLTTRFADAEVRPAPRASPSALGDSVRFRRDVRCLPLCAKPVAPRRLPRPDGLFHRCRTSRRLGLGSGCRRSQRGADLWLGQYVGNFGAALQASLSGWVLTSFDKNGDQQELFIACAVAFALAGCLSFGINAARPVGASAATD